MFWRLACLLVWLALFAHAKPSLAQSNQEQFSLLSGQNYLARVGTNSPQDLERALLRIEQLFSSEPDALDFEPVVMVLHGPEVGVFLRSNYVEHKHLVDLAARLTAFGVVDIRVCETRLGVLGNSPDALVPFVGTVPFGPAEIERLVGDEDYVYF